MAFYIIIPIFTVLLYPLSGFVSRNDPQRQKKIYFVLIGFALVSVMGLRDVSVGTDTLTYAEAYELINNYLPISSWQTTHYEVLYFLFNKFIGLFTDNPANFLFVESVLIVFLLLRFIWRHSSNPVLSTLLFELAYFYFFAFNISRFYLALGIALIGFDYVVKQKALKAVIFPAIGMLIHTSIVLLLVAFLVFSCIKKISDSDVVLIGIAAYALSFFAEGLFAVFVEIFDRYQVYYSIESTVTSGIALPAILFLVVLGGLLLLDFSKKDLETQRIARIEAVFILFGASLLLMGGSIEEAGRTAQMFLIFLIVFVPKVAQGSRYGNVFNVSIIAVFSVYFISQLLANNAGIVPYILGFSF